MEDQRTMILVLKSNDSRQLLLEAGSTVLVMDGQLAVRRPMLLAEQTIFPEVLLAAEQAWVVEAGGWVTLQALGCVECVLIPPNGISFWREVGRCLQTLFVSSESALR